MGREGRDARGRPPVSSRGEIARLGLALFAERGFDAVTGDDVAAAAGIGRRTFFRYYASKNDVVWGEFDRPLREMADWLATAPADRPLLEVLAEAVGRFNRLPPEAVADHRLRMRLILEVPALQAHAALRYADWRAVVAGYAASRLGQPAEALAPQLVAHLALAASVAAYEAWLRVPGSDLGALLDGALRSVRLDLAVLPRLEQDAALPSA